jgi:dCMP deaminase
MTRPPWDEYFFDVAARVATRATCPRAAVGCVIVQPTTHRILATGYNGARPTLAHCTDVGCTVLADHCVRAIHAEVNATEQIMPGLRTLVAYVVGPRPVCSHCAAALYAVGVREVKWREVAPTLDRVIADVNAWQAETFPRATPASVVEHLRREVAELVADPTNTSELADVVFLAVGLAYELDVDLTAIVADKLAVNKRRTWGQPDHLGVIEHIREAVS